MLAQFGCRNLPCRKPGFPQSVLRADILLNHRSKDWGGKGRDTLTMLPLPLLVSLPDTLFPGSSSVKLCLTLTCAQMHGNRTVLDILPLEPVPPASSSDRP